MSLELRQVIQFLTGIQHVLAGCFFVLRGLDLDIVSDAERLGHLAFVPFQQA